MTGRREFILGGLGLAAAGAAYGLHPHKSQNLLGGLKMADLLPKTFGAWESQTADGLVRPETEGRLAAQLYSEIVSRIYAHRESGAEVMMLIAYGDTQSDLLQLHRPESCYPAVGFRLTKSVPIEVVRVGRAVVPGREVVAEKGERLESILYWTRLGEFLPASGGEQQTARLKTALKGFVPDGALFRFSVIGEGEAAVAVLRDFIGGLLSAVKPEARPALIGTELARLTRT